MNRHVVLGSCVASCLLAVTLPLATLNASQPEVSPAAPSMPQPSTSPDEASGGLTPRMLTAPNALMGPVPSSLSWAPQGARLAYVYPADGHDVLAGDQRADASQRTHRSVT